MSLPPKPPVPASLTASPPASLPACLSTYLPACLPACQPACLSPSLPSSHSSRCSCSCVFYLFRNLVYKIGPPTMLSSLMSLNELCCAYRIYDEMLDTITARDFGDEAGGFTAVWRCRACKTEKVFKMRPRCGIDEWCVSRQCRGW